MKLILTHSWVKSSPETNFHLSRWLLQIVPTYWLNFSTFWVIQKSLFQALCWTPHPESSFCWTLPLLVTHQLQSPSSASHKHINSNPPGARIHDVTTVTLPPPPWKSDDLITQSKRRHNFSLQTFFDSHLAPRRSLFSAVLHCAIKAFNWCFRKSIIARRLLRFTSRHPGAPWTWKKRQNGRR